MLGQVLRRQLFRPVVASIRLKCSGPAVVISSHHQTKYILQKPYCLLHSCRQVFSSSKKLGPSRDGQEEDHGKIIDRTIAENAVVIFSKSFCPFCAKIKEFFANKGIPYKNVDLDLMGNQGAEIQSELLERTGQSTVPSVWIKQKFIGKIIYVYSKVKSAFLIPKNNIVSQRGTLKYVDLYPYGWYLNMLGKQQFLCYNWPLCGKFYHSL